MKIPWLSFLAVNTTAGVRENPQQTDPESDGSIPPGRTASVAPNENPLGNRRELLLNIIRKSKYASTKNLIDRSRIPSGTIQYHLWVLLRDKEIATSKIGRKRVYYLHGTPSPSFLTMEPRSSAPLRRIIDAVVQGSGRSQRQIQQATSISQRMCSYYLTKLWEMGLVRRDAKANKAEYFPSKQLVEISSALNDDKTTLWYDPATKVISPMMDKSKTE